MEKTFDIFLSHNGADQVFTERLARAIEDSRPGPPLNVFFDRWDIPPGADIPIEVEQGLQQSRYVGLILSPESISSEWVTLERSTAIYRDPAARQRTLIPLMHRDCDVPDMLARIKSIDFRREQDFDGGVATLIGILRGLAPPRGSNLSDADIQFRQDAHLLHQHRRIFDRAAFNVPCVYELFLSQILDAIDDTTAALNTGSLFSRDGNSLATFDDRTEYRLPEFKQAFRNINLQLRELKRRVLEFENFFQGINPGYSHHRNFYAMVGDAADRTPAGVGELVARMDGIDTARNEILGELNPLLERCGDEPFETIELSSLIIKQGRIGWMKDVSEMIGDAPPSSTT